jgi:hypothetical protein
LRAHGVEVRQCVGRRDLPEIEGIVDDRCEEVGRYDQGPTRIQPPDGGVIRRPEPDQEIGARLLLEEITQRPQDLRQRFRAQLRRSTGAGGHAGEPDLTTAGRAQLTHLGRPPERRL